MGRYYVLDSGGAFTNLQLYSLKEALRCWFDLRLDYEHEGDHTSQLKERCVFAVAALGLSLSQLLGQNDPFPEPNSVRFPRQSFRSLATIHNFDKTLVSDFERFLDVYNRCRHFGITVSGNAHRAIDDLTIERTEELFEIGERVWLAVIRASGRERGNRLRDFSFEAVLEEPVIYQDEDDTPWFDDEELDAPLDGET